MKLDSMTLRFYDSKNNKHAKTPVGKTDIDRKD